VNDDQHPVTRVEFEHLSQQLEENTKVTKEVRDILTTLNVLLRVAKFVAAVAAAGVAVVALWKQIRGI
jgi:hypothetical protein